MLRDKPGQGGLFWFIGSLKRVKLHSQVSSLTTFSLPVKPASITSSLPVTRRSAQRHIVFTLLLISMHASTMIFESICLSCMKDLV